MNEKSENTSKRPVVGGDFIGVIIILGILIAANVLISKFGSLRADLTREQLYTLSEGTKSLLKQLPRDVTLKFYFSRSGTGVPHGLKLYGQRIQDLLREYRKHGHGKVKLEIYDPKPDSDEEEWARKYGLQGQSMNPFGGDPAYLGLAVTAGKREEIISFFSPRMEPRLEYEITRLVHETTRKSRPKIGVMSGLPVFGMRVQPFQQSPGGPPKWAFIRELEKFFEVQEVLSTEETIPDDIDTLLIVHPKVKPDITLFAIDQFVLRGGRLMIFTDPMCYSEQIVTGRQNQFGGMGNTSEMNKLLGAWGIEMPTDKLVGDIKAATPVPGNNGGVERSITYLSLRGDQIDQKDPALNALELVRMPLVGRFTGKPAEGLEMTSLLMSSAESGTVPTFAALQPADEALKSLEREGFQAVAVRLKGTFKTAFPDGPPEIAEAGADEEEKKEEGPKNVLTESQEEGLVILFADVDFIYDNFMMERVRDLFGNIRMVPSNNNLAMVLNLVEQLSGSLALIGLRSRGTFDRPFTRVEELEKEAQLEWQGKLQALEGETKEIEQRINELQAAKTKEQQFRLSPEQQAEVQKWRDKRFETEKKLKEVRKNLRSEIETLGNWLKFANIGAVPILVGIFGLLRGLVRRRRAVAKNQRA